MMEPAMLRNQIDQIINELCNSVNCKEALACYNELGVNISRAVLERGSTDFDRPYGTEDGVYKVEAYINQYLKMHYQRNVAVFGKCEFLDIPKSCLFIDFGCGPMTSGLALVKRLGIKRAREAVAYWGIDISRRMLEKSTRINNYYRLFFDANFSRSFGESNAYGKMTVRNDFENDCIVVVNFSYVLSEMTLKGDDFVSAIVSDITKISSYVFAQDCPMYIIYQNPDSSAALYNKMHGNWATFKQHLSTEFLIKQEYVGVCPYTTYRLKKTFYATILIGRK